MYTNGQQLTEDRHFEDHINHNVPIQIYCDERHDDIGFIEKVSIHYVKVNNTFYRRSFFTFISRPGY